MENLFSLMKIRQYYESGDYERIIVDCAPSGETISMLKLPELLAWYFEKLFPVGRMAIRMLSPFTKVFMKVEMPRQEALSDVEKLYKTMLELQDLLKDSEVTTIRLVCTPEKMVVDETKRSFMYLNLYHYQVDGLYINRVIPDLADNRFMTSWHQIQAGYIAELERVFAQIPITKIPWYPDEIRGMDSVEQFCRENFSPETIEEVFSVRVRDVNEVYEETRDGYKLRLSLPFAQADEVKVTGLGSDLEVHIGNYRRTIPLPNTLANNTILGSRFADGWLEVEFFADKGGIRR
jgi:arsenite-transporting ATPase